MRSIYANTWLNPRAAEFAQLEPTSADIEAFKARLVRLDAHETVAPERCAPPIDAMACPDCAATNHAHKSAQVGPYVICRCLSCPVVTVDVP